MNEHDIDHTSAMILAICCADLTVAKTDNEHELAVAYLDLDAEVKRLKEALQNIKDKNERDYREFTSGVVLDA